MKNLIKNLTFAGLVTLGSLGISDCSKKVEYDAVTIKNDGTKVGYVDFDHNGKFEYVDVTKKGQETIRYARGLLDDSLLSKLQKEYDSLRNVQSN